MRQDSPAEERPGRGLATGIRSLRRVGVHGGEKLSGIEHG